MLKLLILTQYYPPEVGAPQNRLASLVRNLKARGAEVEVLTATPNYPALRVMRGYKNQLRRTTEHVEGVSVHRVPILLPTTKNTLTRLITYFSFCLSVLIFSKRADKFDFILCESPPLFLGVPGLLLCRRYKSKLVFNVSDLWPESVKALGVIKNSILLDAAYKLEKFIYERSTSILGQTESICRDIKARFPATNPVFFPNGVDTSQFSDFAIKDGSAVNLRLGDKVTFFYAGVLGHAQGLEVIIKAREHLRSAENEVYQRSAFVIFGDGAEKGALQALNENSGTDVIFVDSIPRAQLLATLATLHVGIVPLRQNALFEGAIPSKIFDSLALGKPILLAVDGEAKAKFIDQVQCGIFVRPEDHVALAAAVKRLTNNESLRNELGQNGKRMVTQHYDRGEIALNIKSHLESLE